MVERRDLLMEEASQRRELTSEEEQKLRKAVDDGSLYLALTNSAGWKKLLEEYINIEVSQEKYLMAPTEKLADIRAAQLALIHLIQFIQLKVKAGQDSFNMLKESAKQGG
jgi:hypothetical protein